MDKFRLELNNVELERDEGAIQPHEQALFLRVNFADGTWRCVATSRVLNEGVDIPAAQVGVVLSGTSTVRDHVQRLGRILRPSEGKQAVLYEVITADTTEVSAAERRRDHDAYR